MAMQTQRPIKRALISTSDKSGVVEFATQLRNNNVDILATGGTFKVLSDNNIQITEVADYTGFPEVMDGRVKTLHPKIHGGLLARPDIDEQALAEHQIAPIDLLTVNLYPFRETIRSEKCTMAEAIEQIDIGGPAMLRAAAKNFARVTVIIDPADYPLVLEEMAKHHGCTTLATRHMLAQKVFAYISEYDHAIAEYLQQNQQNGVSDFPQHHTINLQKQYDLRYGENPHQQAAFYSNQQAPSTGTTLAGANLIQGKPLSYNNLLDADCALECTLQFASDHAACTIVKHATPCGVAIGANPIDAYQKAYATDPSSAFGGIIAINMPIQKNLAEVIVSQQFVEVIIAPSIDADAQQVFAKKPNLRLLVTGPFQPHSHTALRSISGGLLLQTSDTLCENPSRFTIVSQRQPTSDEMQDLLFSWQVVKYVKSNAIVYCNQQATLGIGGGQTSRVFAAKIAALKAQEANLSLADSVMASDAFFPFADGVEVAAQHGIRAIIQPGGSKRDDEVIACANSHDIAMVFTGQRHFRH